MKNHWTRHVSAAVIVAAALVAAPATAFADGCNDSDGDGYYNVDNSATGNYNHGSVTAGTVQHCLTDAKNTAGITGVELVEGQTYQTLLPITIPGSIHLIVEGVGSYKLTSATIKAAGTQSSLTGDAVIKMNNYSKLQGVRVDANWVARNAVKASGTTGATIDGNGLFRSRKDDNVSGNAGLLLANGSSYLTVSDNHIKYAGTDRNEGTGSASQAGGVYAHSATDMNIDRNTIAYIQSAGVNVTDAYRVDIESNTIVETGLANKSGVGGAAADGITSYSQSCGSCDHDIDIMSNEVRDYGNHGIHFSGEGFYLYNNTVGARSSWALGFPISVADHQPSPYDCTTDPVMNFNKITRGRDNVYIAAGRNHPTHTSSGNPTGWSMYDNKDQYGNSIPGQDLTDDINSAEYYHCA